MAIPIYDYVIIGAGAAGLHLSLAMLEDSWFADKKILIIDKDAKVTNDKFWSFGEKEKGKWDEIIEKSWAKGKFNTKNKSINLDLHPYLYKTLPAINFYNFAKKQIAQSSIIDWVKDEILKVDRVDKTVKINGKKNQYLAKQVFDSRIDKGFNLEKNNILRSNNTSKGG